MKKGCSALGKISIGKIVPTTRISLSYSHWKGVASSIQNESRLMQILKTALMVRPNIMQSAIAGTVISLKPGITPTITVPITTASPAYMGSLILHSPVYFARIYKV